MSASNETTVVYSANLSDATPANTGTAAAGTSTNASRADHVHNLPDLVTAATVGASSKLVRSVTYNAKGLVSGAATEVDLGALATGLLLNTTTTGALSVAVAGTGYVAPDVAIAAGKKLIIDSNTTLSNCALQISGDIDTGILQSPVGGANSLSIVAGGVESLRVTANNVRPIGDLDMPDSGNIKAGTSTGCKIGTATGQKIAFWNSTPVVQQVLATGAAHTVDDVITLLQTLGLAKQS